MTDPNLLKSLKQALRDAKRTGDTDYAKELEEEIAEMEQQTVGKLVAASESDALAKADLVQKALSPKLNADMFVEEGDSNDFVQITLGASIPLATLILALSSAGLRPKQLTRQRIKHGKNLIMVIVLPAVGARLYLQLDDFGQINTIEVL